MFAHIHYPPNIHRSDLGFRHTHIFGSSHIKKKKINGRLYFLTYKGKRITKDDTI